MLLMTVVVSRGSQWENRTPHACNICYQGYSVVSAQLLCTVHIHGSEHSCQERTMTSSYLQNVSNCNDDDVIMHSCNIVISETLFALPEWCKVYYGKQFLPAGHTQPTGPKIALRFPHLLVCDFVHLHYHICNKYVMYNVTVWLYFSRLRTAALNTDLASMSSLAKLRVQSRGNLDATV